MSSSLSHRCLRSAQTLSARDLARLFEIAARLQRDAAEGRAASALAGRHLALLGTLERADAQAFVEAAAGLGAQVAHIDAEALGSASEQRLLGRLYDSVDACGLAIARIDQLEALAGVPVSNGLADAQHPLRLLGDLLTMQAWSGRALPALRVELAEPAMPQARALAALASLSLQEPATVAAGDAATGEAPSCDFVWRAGRNAAERVLLPHGEPVPSALAQMARSYERLALQALLVAALG